MKRKHIVLPPVRNVRRTPNSWCDGDDDDDGEASSGSETRYNSGGGKRPRRGGRGCIHETDCPKGWNERGEAVKLTS